MSQEVCLLARKDDGSDGRGGQVEKAFEFNGVERVRGLCVGI